MRNIDGRATCALCGAALGVPIGTKIRTVLQGAGGKPNVRVIYVGDEEIHRCATTH
jgi:hypothetical protein